MRIPKLVFAAATVALAACATVPPAAVPVVPTVATGLTTADKAPFGPFLVDSNGRAVYVLDGTRLQDPTARCSGECLHHWPPVLSTAPLVAASGLDAAQVGTIPAYAGAQATYAGWPLYYYHRDTAPGDTTGQNVHDQWGVWYLLSAAGQPIRPAGGY